MPNGDPAPVHKGCANACWYAQDLGVTEYHCNDVVGCRRTVYEGLMTNAEELTRRVTDMENGVYPTKKKASGWRGIWKWLTEPF